MCCGASVCCDVVCLCAVMWCVCGVCVCVLWGVCVCVCCGMSLCCSIYRTKASPPQTGIKGTEIDIDPSIQNTP